MLNWKLLNPLQIWGKNQTLLVKEQTFLYIKRACRYFEILHCHDFTISALLQICLFFFIPVSLSSCEEDKICILINYILEQYAKIKTKTLTPINFWSLCMNWGIQFEQTQYFRSTNTGYVMTPNNYMEKGAEYNLDSSMFWSNLTKPS
jgi:hypothetical protein